VTVPDSSLLLQLVNAVEIAVLLSQVMLGSI
jgi:hypothetical protein